MKSVESRNERNPGSMQRDERTTRMNYYCPDDRRFPAACCKKLQLMQFAGINSYIRIERKLKNIVLRTTEAGYGQLFIVVSVVGEEDAATASQAAYTTIAEALSDRRMTIVHERIFGSLRSEAAVLRERNTALSGQQVPADGPVTYSAGDPPWGEGLAGVIIHAVSMDRADDVWMIMDGESACGRGWRKNGMTYLMLQNIQGQA